MVSDGMIDSHQIKFSVGGLRFDRDIEVGWKISPSIGLVAKDIDKMGLAITSFKEPLTRAIVTVMIPSFRKNFEQSGRPKWKKLAPYTLQVKGQLGISDGDKPLHRTGALKRAATMLRIWDIGNTSATIRKLPEDVWYGAIHQSGYGGFGVFVAQAKKSLGPRASGADVLNLAFKLNDAARGGKGKVAGAAAIPQRQFIMYQEDDIDDIQDVFYEWLVDITVEEGRFSR